MVTETCEVCAGLLIEHTTSGASARVFSGAVKVTEALVVLPSVSVMPVQVRAPWSYPGTVPSLIVYVVPGMRPVQVIGVAVVGPVPVAFWLAG